MNRPPILAFVLLAVAGCSPTQDGPWWLAFSPRGELPTAFAASGPVSAAEEGRLGVPEESLWLVLDHAEEQLAAGDLDDALRLFELADRLDVHEVPSYEGLIGWAEALCRKGEAERGAGLLRDFRCTLAVDSAALPCYIGAPTADAPGEPNPVLTEGCFERMCGEAYLAYYDHPTAETLAWVAEAGAGTARGAPLREGSRDGRGVLLGRAASLTAPRTPATRTARRSRPRTSRGSRGA